MQNGFGQGDALALLSLDFQKAAIGAATWETALGALADYTGSAVAELIGFGDASFHLHSGLHDSALVEFARAGGTDIRVNSRIRVGLNAPDMKILDESHFTTDEDCRRFPEYGAFIDNLDLRYIGLTNLLKRPGSQIGLSVVRSAKAGNIDGDHHRLFAAVAPHVLSAISTSMALEGRALILAAQAMDRLDEAAFIVDQTGRIQALTARAEGLMARQIFRRAGGRLALCRGDDAALQMAVARILRRGLETSRPILAHDENELGFLVHVSALPRQHGFGFDAAALIVAKPPRDIEVNAAFLARQVFHLTPMESAAAGLLMTGLSPLAVADRQGVSLGTIRTHIRKLLEKSGTRSQAEFMAALASRL